MCEDPRNQQDGSLAIIIIINYEVSAAGTVNRSPRRLDHEGKRDVQKGRGVGEIKCNLIII